MRGESSQRGDERRVGVLCLGQLVYRVAERLSIGAAEQVIIDGGALRSDEHTLPGRQLWE